MPIETIRTIVEDEARERKLIAVDIEQIQNGLESLADQFERLTEERDAHRARAREVLDASRATAGKCERMEAVLIQIAKNARMTGADSSKLAQVAERAIASERKRTE